MLFQFPSALADGSSPLQFLQKTIQHLIHGRIFILPADSALPAGHADTSGNLGLHTAQLLCSKILFVAVHLSKCFCQLFKRLRISCQSRRTAHQNFCRFRSQRFPFQKQISIPPESMDKSGNKQSFQNGNSRAAHRLHMDRRSQQCHETGASTGKNRCQHTGTTLPVPFHPFYQQCRQHNGKTVFYQRQYRQKQDHASQRSQKKNAPVYP